jgi:hypothetical protein
MMTRIVLTGAITLAWGCASISARTPPAPRVTGHWRYAAYTDSGDSSVGSLSIFPRASATVGVVEMPGSDSVNVEIHWNGASLWFAAPSHAAPDPHGPVVNRFFGVVASPQPDGSLRGTWSLENGQHGVWRGQQILTQARP